MPAEAVRGLVARPALLDHDVERLIREEARHGKRALGEDRAIFDGDDPSVLIARCRDPFLVPDLQREREGQTGNVCFIEGLVPFAGEWLLYFGMADSLIGVASAPLR